jgi:glycosyltransferase involved in cell wall biosynthesis
MEDSSARGHGLPMPQQIIHIPRRFVAHEWGGTETVIAEIARQQQAAGFAPKIVTSMALAKTKREEIAGIPVERHRYCYPFFGLSAADRAALDKKGGNLLSLPLLASLATQRNVRLFHAHSLKRLGATVATAARWQGKPFVVSLHGGVFDVPKEELATMQRPVAGRFEWGRAFGALLGSRRLLDDADMIICVGQSELDAAKSQLSHDRIAYLPNGVDSQKFSQGDGARFRARLGIPQDAFLVLNVSRIDAQKNQMVLVEAFSALSRQDSAARLVLIGPETQPDYARKLRERIAELRLADRVNFLPGLKNDDPALVDAFHASDVFVLPSVHEPFGIVVLEAWSAGKPVIASPVGGLKTLIRGEETGLFFEGRDELYQCLDRLRQSPARRAVLGEAGQNEARLHYDWSRINERLEGLYEEAAAHHARRRGAPSLSPVPTHA